MNSDLSAGQHYMFGKSLSSGKLHTIGFGTTNLMDSDLSGLVDRIIRGDPYDVNY